MNSKAPRKKIPVKSIFHHVIRAKLYAILTMNGLEGMMVELNHLLPQEFDRQNFDIFDEHLRRFQNGMLFPTSHGDYIDRAVKSLAKELDIPVNVELVNAQAVKKVIMSIARGASDQDKSEILDWLNENNEFIVKSPRYDQLIDHACMYFYKKPASQVSEDTLSFIRRSANELLRNKASKDAMRKRIMANDDEDEASIEKLIRDNDGIPREFDINQVDISRVGMADEDDSDDGSDNDLILDSQTIQPLLEKRGRNAMQDSDLDYVSKRGKENNIQL